jgi:hypothetical protein
VFVSAWNPFGRPRGRIVNALAHRRLVAALRAQEKRFLDGEGRGDDGDWPPERSILAFGFGQAAAAALGRRFRQNAVVFAARGRPAELLMLR